MYIIIIGTHYQCGFLKKDDLHETIELSEIFDEDPVADGGRDREQGI